MERLSTATWRNRFEIVFRSGSGIPDDALDPGLMAGLALTVESTYLPRPGDEIEIDVDETLDSTVRYELTLRVAKVVFLPGGGGGRVFVVSENSWCGVEGEGPHGGTPADVRVPRARVEVQVDLIGSNPVRLERPAPELAE